MQNSQFNTIFSIHLSEEELTWHIEDISYSSKFRIQRQTIIEAQLILSNSLLILKIQGLQFHEALRACILTKNITFRVEKNLDEFRQDYYWKLIIKCQQDLIKFYSPKKEDMKNWNSFLGQKIHKLGFQDDFKPVRRLGQGASAKVYMVQDKLNKKFYATKAFSKKDYFTNHKTQQSINYQIELLKCLSKRNHQNLISFYEVYQSQTSIHVLIQLYDGVLNTIFSLDESQRLDWDTDKVMRDILNGLKELHGQGIVHRDINPNNIAIRLYRHNIIKSVIIDLGCSTQIAKESYLYYRCGTPGYLAPEIFLMREGDMLMNCKCDIFSAGLIFHLLLLNFHPFIQSNNREEIIRNNKHLVINFEAEQYQTLGNVQYDLLKRMLDYNPETRISAQQALKHKFFHQDLLDSHQQATQLLIESPKKISLELMMEKYQSQKRKLIKKD